MHGQIDGLSTNRRDAPQAGLGRSFGAGQAALGRAAGLGIAARRTVAGRGAVVLQPAGPVARYRDRRPAAQFSWGRRGGACRSVAPKPRPCRLSDPDRAVRLGFAASAGPAAAVFLAQAGIAAAGADPGDAGALGAQSRGGVRSLRFGGSHRLGPAPAAVAGRSRALLGADLNGGGGCRRPAAVAGARPFPARLARHRRRRRSRNIGGGPALAAGCFSAGVVRVRPESPRPRPAPAAPRRGSARS